MNEQTIKDIDRAFKALEERDELLDKMKDEIKEITPTYHNPDWSVTDLVPISEVLKLIDKYKADAESEA